MADIRIFEKTPDTPALYTEWKLTDFEKATSDFGTLEQVLEWSGDSIVFLYGRSSILCTSETIDRIVTYHREPLLAQVKEFFSNKKNTEFTLPMSIENSMTFWQIIDSIPDSTIKHHFDDLNEFLKAHKFQYKYIKYGNSAIKRYRAPTVVDKTKNKVNGTQLMYAKRNVIKNLVVRMQIDFNLDGVETNVSTNVFLNNAAVMFKTKFKYTIANALGVYKSRVGGAPTPASLNELLSVATDTPEYKQMMVNALQAWWDGCVEIQ